MPAVHKVQVKLPAQVGHHTLQVLFAQLHTARGAGQDREWLSAFLRYCLQAVRGRC